MAGQDEITEAERASIGAKPIAYVTHPITPEVKRAITGKGFRILDAKFAPPGAEIIGGGSEKPAAPAAPPAAPGANHDLETATALAEANRELEARLEAVTAGAKDQADQILELQNVNTELTHQVNDLQAKLEDAQAATATDVEANLDLKKQLEELEAVANEQIEDLKKQLATAKGQITKLKKELDKGEA